MTEIDAEIKALEQDMMEQKERLAALRRKRPPEPVKDYVFMDTHEKGIKLSELFGKKSELILVHNMGIQCSSCTLWADGFNGILKHIESEVAFVVESPDPVETQRTFAMDRAWAFKMVSSKGTPFRKDMGYEGAKRAPWPGISCFKKTSGGKVVRVSHTGLGPGDNFCVFWDLLQMRSKPPTWNEGDYFYKAKLKK